MPIGTLAIWDSDARTLACVSHDAPLRAEIEILPKLESIGIAGGSADEMRARFEKRDHENAVKEKEQFASAHPFLSRFISPQERQSHEAKVWAKGAQGEVEVGNRLEELGKKYSFAVIHDRQIPGSKANIDHMAITSTGIFIVDAKNYEGTIEVRKRLDGLISGESELWIGGRNRTKLVDGVKKQMLAVENVLEREKVKFPVFGALAFANARWDLPQFLRANSVRGVLLNSKGLESIFEGMKPNDGNEISDIASLLVKKLRPARN